MQISISTGAANAMVGTSGLKGALESGSMELRIYAGTMPTDANDAIGSATLLVTIKNGASPMTWSTPSGGVISKPSGDTWSGVAVADGVATFGRFVHAADTGASSTSDIRVQGDVGSVGAFINLDNTAIVNGTVQTANSAQLIQPRS